MTITPHYHNSRTVSGPIVLNSPTSTTTITVDRNDVIDIDLLPRTIQQEQFSLTPRYIPMHALGHGAYGVVICAADSVTKQYCAIKKCKSVFPTGSGVRTRSTARTTLVPLRILREMKIMSHLSQCPYVVHLHDIVPPSSYHSFKDVYFVSEFMDADLRDFLVTGQQLSDKHVQYIMFQLLSGVAYMHSAGIVHRDLKPENLLINADCSLRICDFGLARGLDEQDPTMSTNYVTTRYYRAPELLLDNPDVSFAIDMWSVGCIMAELLGSGILFKGASPVQQIDLILSALGTQETDGVKGSPQGIQFLTRMPYKEPKPVSELVPNCTNPEAIDLLTKMLQFNPEKRISALDALRHPYLKRIRDQLGEELCSKKFDFSYEERVAGDLSEIKREAWNTLLEFCKITRKCETDIVSPHAGCDSPVTESSPDPIQKELNLRLESQNVLSKTQEKKTKRNVLSRIKRFFGKCK